MVIPPTTILRFLSTRSFVYIRRWLSLSHSLTNYICIILYYYTKARSLFIVIITRIVRLFGRGLNDNELITQPPAPFSVPCQSTPPLNIYNICIIHVCVCVCTLHYNTPYYIILRRRWYLCVRYGINDRCNNTQT